MPWRLLATFVVGVLAIGLRRRHAGAVPLSPMEASILDFERSWWADDQPKDAAIADRFALTVAEYYELLNTLIDSDEALEHDQMVVRRLRRMRDRRRRERFDEIADGSSS